MRRRVLCVGMAVTMICMSLAGCSKTAKKEEETTKAVTEAEETTEEPTEEETTQKETEAETTQKETEEETTEAKTDAPEETQEPEETEGVQVSPEAQKAMDFFDAMYAKIDEEALPAFIEQHEADLNDSDMLAFQTGLSSAEGVSSIVLSESMISSVAYSLMYVTLEDGTDSEEFMDTLLKSVDPAKWICVHADYVCANTFDGDVFLVMTNSDLGDIVYDAAVETAEELGMEVGTRKDL